METPQVPPERWAGAPQRYPDPAVVTLDERFGACVIGNAAVERIATGMRWAEGPVWFGDHRCLVWSDIPNNRHAALGRGERRRDRRSAARRTTRNGNTRDRQGRLVTCEHGSRGVTRTEHDGHDHRAAGHASTASRSTPPTTWSSRPTARSGSPTRATGSSSDYEGEKAELRAAHARSTASTRRRARRASSLEASSGRTASASRRTSRCSTSSTPARARSTIHAYRRERRRHRSAAARIFADMTPGRLGRHPLRRGRQPLGGGAVGGDGLRRRARLRPRRHAHRPDRPAREVRERLLRRPVPQPPLHDRQPVGLRAVRERARDLSSGERRSQDGTCGAEWLWSEARPRFDRPSVSSSLRVATTVDG